MVYYCDTFNTLWSIRYFDQFYHMMIDGYLTVQLVSLGVLMIVEN